MSDGLLKGNVKVPAKGMLFGEYGVLSGYPAVAVTFPECHFQIDFEWHNASPDRPALEVESAFLPENSLHIQTEFLNELQRMKVQNDVPFLRHLYPHSLRHQCFFTALLFPYLHLFQTHSLKVCIRNSFAPELGFGSSSALLAAFHQVLYGAHEKGCEKSFAQDGNFLQDMLSSENFWHKIWTSLAMAQGGGSGYDVACQLAAGQSAGTQMWVYEKGLVPKIRQIPHVQAGKKIDLGVFLATGICSDTALEIQNFRKNALKSADFSKRHGKIALDFLENPCNEVLPELMRRSREISFEQGILPLPENETRFGRLQNELLKNNISYKSMGAGAGDCLWVLASQQQINALLEIKNEGTGLESNRSFFVGHRF